jgi:hypothetical protein
MATDLNTLCAYCEDLNYSFERHEEIGAATVHVPYGENDGEKPIPMLIRTYDDGDIFLVWAQLTDTELHRRSEYKLEFMFYLLHKTWTTKFGTPAMDRDGKVRFLVEIPLMDAPLTRIQFAHILKVTAATVAEMREEGNKVLLLGELPFSKSDEVTESLQNPVSADKALDILGLVKLSATEEGLIKLEAITNDPGVPEALRAEARKILALANASSDVPDQI